MRERERGEGGGEGERKREGGREGEREREREREKEREREIYGINSLDVLRSGSESLPRTQKLSRDMRLKLKASLYSFSSLL